MDDQQRRTLGLREHGWLRDDEAISGVPFYYAVTGLPDDRVAKVAYFDHRWQIMRRLRDEVGSWTGRYASKEEALAAVQAEWGAL